MTHSNDSESFEFSLAIPASWYELDLNPRTRNKSISETIYQRTLEVPQLRDLRSELTSYLRKLAAQAWDNGARFCAAFAMPVGDGLIMGAFTVTLLPAAPNSGGDPLENVIEELNKEEPSRAEGLWKQMSAVELPEIGMVARQFGVENTQIDAKGTYVKHVFMHTFITRPEGVVLISASSPAVDLSDQLFELFAMVSDTISFQPSAS